MIKNHQIHLFSTDLINILSHDTAKMGHFSKFSKFAEFWCERRVKTKGLIPIGVSPLYRIVACNSDVKHENNLFTHSVIYF